MTISKEKIEVITSVERRRRWSSEENMAIQNVRLTALQNAVKPDRTFEIAGGAANVLVKGSAVVGSKMIAQAGNQTLRTVLKEVPVVSFVFGCVLAAHRCHEGYKIGDRTEYAKAAGEIASGLAACFPGYGTAVSIGLDAALVTHDIYEAYKNPIRINLDLANAHRTLGLNPANEVNQATIDRAFMHVSRLMHMDEQFGEYTQQELDHLHAVLAEAKNVLYGHYGYNRDRINLNVANAHEILGLDPANEVNQAMIDGCD